IMAKAKRASFPKKQSGDKLFATEVNTLSDIANDHAGLIDALATAPATAATATFLKPNPDLLAAIFQLSNAPLTKASLRYLKVSGNKKSAVLRIFNYTETEKLPGDCIVVQ